MRSRWTIHDVFLKVTIHGEVNASFALLAPCFFALMRALKHEYPNAAAWRLPNAVQARSLDCAALHRVGLPLGWGHMLSSPYSVEARLISSSKYLAKLTLNSEPAT